MFLKKLIAGIIALAAIALMLSNGFQQLSTTKTHIMNGKVMTTEEMPSQGCSQKNCFIKITGTLLIATFFKLSIKETPAFLGLLATLSLLAFLALKKKNLFAFNLAPFNSGQLVTSTIVFRE